MTIKLDKNATSTRHLYTFSGEGMKPRGDLLIEVTNTIPANIKENDRGILLEILKKYATLEL